MSAFVFSLLIFLFVEKKVSISKLVGQNMLGWALVLGVLEFGGTYFLIKALSVGTTSLVFIIVGLYTFFATVFASLFFEEKVTAKNIVFIILSFLVVLLIKFGS